MPINVKETYGAQLSGERSPTERNKRFKITGTDNEDVAYAALSSFVYANFPQLGRLIVKNVSLDEGVPGAFLWEGTASYGKRDKKALRGERPEISFSTKGGTAKITRGIRTVQAVARPVPVYQFRWVAPNGTPQDWKDADLWTDTPEEEQERYDQGYKKEDRIKTEQIPDASGNPIMVPCTKPGKPINFHNGINFENGSFQGCEKVVPALNCTVALSVPDERVNPFYQRLLLSMTGKVNSKPFLGFKAGEWLFMGADVNSRYEEDEEENDDEGDEEKPPKIYWDISYEFRGSPNVTNQYIAGLGPFSKRGHDYAWAYSEKRESTDEDKNPDPSDDEEGADPGTETLEFSDEKMTVVAPLCVYAEQVYYYADFTALGLSL